MPYPAWLKLFLALLLGFWFGVMLGFLSSFLMYYCLPAKWIANGFEARRARHDRFLLGRECRVSDQFSSCFSSIMECYGEVERCGNFSMSTSDNFLSGLHKQTSTQRITCSSSVTPNLYWQNKKLTQSMIQRNGFFERFDAISNAVEICACWSDGVGSAAFTQITCSKLKLPGHGELGLR